MYGGGSSYCWDCDDGGSDGSGSDLGNHHILKYHHHHQQQSPIAAPHQVGGVYMATRLFLNLCQAYIPFYLQDSLGEVAIPHVKTHKICPE